MRAMFRMGAVVAALFLVMALAGPAFAGHAHSLTTPGTTVENIASGQTAIDDESHGGWHRFHFNVHVGKAGTAINERTPVTIGVAD